MKIIHTGDWHLGKIVNDFSLIEDQVYILDRFFAIIEAEQPDAIMIAGDIYDRSIPPKEAVELLDTVLTKIIEEYKIPVFIIAGNHDSQERLSFGNRLLEHKKLFIEGTVKETVKEVVLNDEFGPVHFYLVPYAHPALVRQLYHDEEVTDHNSAFQAVIRKIKLNQAERNILMTHNYIISDTEELFSSDSERSLSIGGTEYVDAGLVKDFDYVAIGHLHRMQKVKHDYIRYSGSLLKYSFSEADSEKGVIITEIKNKGIVETRAVPLKPVRDMRIIKGRLEELIKNRSEDYIQAVLTDKNDLYNPVEALRAVYPNIMQLIRADVVTNIESVTKAGGNFKSKSKFELFLEFYRNMKGEAMDEKKISVLKTVIEEAEREEAL